MSFSKGFYNQNHSNKQTKPKRIKNHNDPSVSFTHGLLGDVNFDFAYLNSNGKRTKALIDYWNRKNKISIYMKNLNIKLVTIGVL